MQTVRYFNFVGGEVDIRNGRFKWSRASTFNYNSNAIGLAVAYASAIRTHLLVHDTSHPMSASSVRPRSAANCLIRSAVDISHPRKQGNPPASSSAASGPVRSDIINGFGAGAIGGCCNPSLISSMPPGVIPGPVDSASTPPSSGRGNYLPTQSQASYHNACSGPLACRPSSGFDGVNKEADVRANTTIVDGHANVPASAVLLDLAFGAVDVNVNLACTSLLSPPSLLLRPAVGPSYGLFVERSAEPIDNPARPHWPLPTVHTTRAQYQTEDQHEPVFSFIENPNVSPT